MMRNPLRSLLLLWAVVCSDGVRAWAETGHRLVGDLAERQLRPEIRALVDELLVGESEPTLAGVANWADALRGSDPKRFQATSQWHYVKSLPGTCAVDMDRGARIGSLWR